MGAERLTGKGGRPPWDLNPNGGAEGERSILENGQA